MSHQPKVSIAERAARYVARLAPAISGSGGHDATFQVASTLVHGFALSQAEAMPIFLEYNSRCSPPWSERELLYKLASAERSTSHKKPRGHLLKGEPPPVTHTGRYVPARPPASQPTPRKLVEYDPSRLRQLAAKYRPIVNIEWLANRAAEDPSQVGPNQYLKLIYQPGEMVLLFTVYKSQGQALWPNEEPPTMGEDGVWYLAQPVNGQTLPNPRTGKKSRRSMESVTAFRYLVLESDKANPVDWLALLVQLPLQIEAIYTSGGKSVHALVRVDCRTHGEWEEYVKGMMPTLNLLGMAGVDPKTLTSVRLTRLPGAMRAGKLQKLLYIQPGATARAICELPAWRDVACLWLEKANRVIDGYGDADRALRRALWYYSPANKACAGALADIEGATA